MISAMRSSEIGPGPLGIAETNPSAEAPYRIAISASSKLLMQQIFTRVLTEISYSVSGALSVFVYSLLSAGQHLR